MEMFYTYILQSDEDSYFYTGSTNNLRRRIEEHNSGNVLSTKKRLPLRLIYYEACMDETDARRRENILRQLGENAILRAV